MRKYEQLQESEAQQLADELRSASKLNQALVIADALTREHPVLSAEIQPRLPLFRVRPTDSTKGYRHPSEVLAPSPNKVKNGRLNCAGQPRLYLSRQFHTALAEARATEGQMFHCIAIRPVGGFSLRVAFIGEHHHVLRTGHLASLGYDPDSTIQSNLLQQGEPAISRIAFADSLMAEILTDPKARENDYAPQRALALSLRRLATNARGILFPSARHQYGWNYALDPPSYGQEIKIVASSVVRVNQVRSNGYFEVETIRHQIIQPKSSTFETIPGAPKRGFAYFNLNEEEVSTFVHEYSNLPRSGDSG